MIKVICPKSIFFNPNEAKRLWTKYKDKLNDFKSFEDLLKDSHFYCFYSAKKFIGCIYFYEKNKKLFVNAFSNRKTHLENLQCLEMSLQFYNCDVYAESSEKSAIYSLLKSGFKKINENTYKYERT